MSDDDNDTLHQRPAISPMLATSFGQLDIGRRLGRFRLDALIGEGGMGKVYEAWDPHLERRVAVKVLHAPDPVSRQRFMREARLQGAISHPGVCPVFEVGQAEGMPYIVMPRLVGQPLDEATADLPLEQKLSLMQQVAEAVHAAHRSGLVHRDLKPANILVETPEDGPPRPVVLDFGIARQVSSSDLTQADRIFGTPTYMAPEQIDQTLQLLDRRADVYALGSTLYCLLTGHPPFSGRGTALLLKVVRDEPAPLRPLGIPADVEAIALKCLEKQKRLRYDSALDLAEDLGRYLDGKPVLARHIGRRVRLAKWMRRHLAAVRVAVVASALLAGALGWGLWTSWQAGEREEMARRFSSQVAEVEALVRYSNLAPLHDVRPDHAELRHRMADIRAAMDGADGRVRSLGHHALGRGHLALDEPEQARQEMATAWDLGLHSSELAADLGLALSEVYRDRLAALERVRDSGGQKSLREQLRQRLVKTFGDPAEQQKQLQRSFGDPARQLLVQSRDPGRPDDAILEPLILFHEGNVEAAVTLLGDLPRRPSWAYESLALEGDMRRSWAVSLDAEGHPDAARQQLEQARRVYAQAMTVAESDASLRLDDAQAVYLLLSLDLVPKAEVAALLEQGLASVQQALAANPDNIRPWLWQGRLHRLGAQQAEADGMDPSPRLTEVMATMQHALELDEVSSAAWYELGRAHWRRGRWLRDQGGDPRSDLQQAAKAFERVASDDRDYAYYTSLGVLHMTVAGQLQSTDRAVTAEYQAAVAAYRAAAERHSAPFAALNNLGVTLFNAAALPDTQPRDMLQQAIDTFERARDLDPDHMVPRYYLGLCYLRLAQGGDPTTGLLDAALATEAVRSLERAVELSPESYQSLAGLGEVVHFQVLDAHDRGDDPAPFFAQSRQAYERALELAPDHPLILLNLGWSYYFEGKFLLRDGDDGAAALRRAEGLCRQTLDAQRRDTALLCLGSVLRMEAERRIVHGGDPSSAFEESRKLFEEILDHLPDDAEAHRSLGRLETLRATWLDARGENPEPAFEKARQSLDRALELAPDIALFWLADARWHLAIGRRAVRSGQPTAETVESARQSLSKARRLRPNWREAEQLQAELTELVEATGISRAR